MQYYLNDKKLNKIEKQKAEKDGLSLIKQATKLKTKLDQYEMM